MVAEENNLLLEMAERSAGGSPESLILPLSRQDFADYLGLSVETVSRALTRLKQNGAITLAARHGVTITKNSTSGPGNGSEV